MGKKREKGVLEIARRELAKEKNETIILYFLLGLTFISVSILLLVLSSKVISSGYASYIDSQAGTVTEVNLYRKLPTDYWHGIYGLALGVTGFNETLSTTVDSGTITRQDLFFGCIEPNAVGGNEVYASTSPDINFSNLSPANPSQVDAFTGCNNSIYNPTFAADHVDCAVNTFTNNMSILVGKTNISGIPSTYTYRFDGNNTVFDLGILTDGSHLVYVTHISGIQKGYSSDKTVNYQMILPSNPNNQTTYYFFTDPYDTCPTGSYGITINSTLYGYVKDDSGNPVSNATVSIAGYTSLTNSSGFYNISFIATEGVHNVFATSSSYDSFIGNITTNSSYYVVPLNITLFPSTPGLNQTLHPTVSGYVKDASTSGTLAGVKIYLGNAVTTSNLDGSYSISPVLSEGQNPITGVKQSYENFYDILNFTANTSTLSYNFSMIPAALNYPYQTGPYTQPPQPPVKIQGQDYWISTSGIDVQVKRNTFLEQKISIYNFGSSPANVVFSLPPGVGDYLKLSQSSLSIPGNSYGEDTLTIYGTRPIGTYTSILTLSGDVSSQVPIKVKVVDNNFPVETLLSQVQLFQDLVSPGSNLTYRLNLQNLLRGQSYQLYFNTSIRDANGKSYSVQQSESEIGMETETLLTPLQNFSCPEVVEHMADPMIIIITILTAIVL